jgi:hypothetical protein
MQFLPILLPLAYLIFFLWVIGYLNYFKTAGFSKTALQFAFILKAFSGLVIYLIYTYYYPVRMEADTFKYFDDSKYLYEALWHKPIDFFKMLLGIDCENDYFLKHYYSKMFNWYRSYDNGLLNDNKRKSETKKMTYSLNLRPNDKSAMNIPQAFIRNKLPSALDK